MSLEPPDPYPLIAPRSIAVVGATERPGSYGDTIFRNLAASGFTGEIYGVNPGRQTVHGRPCLPSLLELPEPVDAVAIAIPAPLVSAAVREAIERGCGGAVVISAGFGEVESGKALEQELKETALAASFPICGPNGNGVVSVSSGASIWGDSLPLLRPGPVAMVSQSGNVAVNALGSRRGIDFHTVVSTGNQTILDTGAWLKALARLEDVRSVALFQETDGDGQTLAEALAACADNGVRVAVLKVGSSEAGGRAAAAHTGAVAGDQRVFRALIEEAGAAWVEDPHELLEVARVLSFDRCRPRARPADRPPDNPATGTAVLTCSGGDSGIAADLAERAGLSLPALCERTRARLEELLPEAATAANPLDYTSLLWTETERLTAIVAAVGEDPAISNLLLFHDHPEDLRPEHESEWADLRRALAEGALQSKSPAMFASTLPDLIDPAARDELASVGIPAVGGMPAAISAAAAISLPEADGARLREIAALAATAHRPGTVGWLPEAETKLLLHEGGVRVPDGDTAGDISACFKVASRLEWPMVLKLSGPHIQHKSDIGAIRLDIRDERQLEIAVGELLALPEAQGANLLVESMEESGVELFVAIRRDGVVPVLAIGLGGIWVELVGDVALVPLPADRGQITRALSGLKGAGLLTGARGRDAVDLDALAGLAAGAARIAIDQGFGLLELNPVIARPDGAVALDAVAGF